jgi:hypothetical protein
VWLKLPGIIFDDADKGKVNEGYMNYMMAFPR